VAKKGNKYKWLFISDIELVGAPDKLRWESIAKVDIVKNYIILEQVTPPATESTLFVINIESGLLGKLKYSVIDYILDYNGNKNRRDYDTFTITNNKEITFNKAWDEELKSGVTTLKLDAIFKELDALGK